MWLYLTKRLDLRWRSLIGTLSLHAIVYALVLSSPVDLRASERTVVPIVLVERASTDEDAPVPIIEGPEEAKEASGEKDIPPTVDDAAESPEEPTAQQLPEAPIVTAESVRPPARTVEPSLTDTDDVEAAEEIVIDPRYKIPFDPFEETAPTALARVSMATMCARVSEATRPDFCPNVSNEDAYLSAWTRPPAGQQDVYDPVADIVFAESTLERFARGQRGHGTRTGSAELERVSQVPRHAEAPPCAPVQTGLQEPSGIASGLELPLGSTDGIQCR